MKNYKIIWTENATIQNLENVEFVFNTWGASSVLDYENELIQKLEQLKKFPFSAPIFKLGCRKILIVKQISLIYKVDKDNKEITILMVWNNYQNPVKLLTD